MNIQALNEDAHHTLTKAKDENERNKIILASGRHRAKAMLDFNTLKEFYVPLIGQYRLCGNDDVPIRFDIEKEARDYAGDIFDNLHVYMSPSKFLPYQSKTIQCTRCRHKHTEESRLDISEKGGVGTVSVCPKCSCKSYYARPRDFR